MREHLKQAGVEHPSIWMHGVDMPACSSLAEDVEGDVCVIGAGISGLTTAYLLAQEGKSVIVLDDGVIGGGMTHLTTAHLASAIDDRYVEMERFRQTDIVVGNCLQCVEDHRRSASELSSLGQR